MLAIVFVSESGAGALGLEGKNFDLVGATGLVGVVFCCTVLIFEESTCTVVAGTLTVDVVVVIVGVDAKVGVVAIVGVVVIVGVVAAADEEAGVVGGPGLESLRAESFTRLGLS